MIAFNQGTDINNIRETKYPEFEQLMAQVTHRFRPPKCNDLIKWKVANFIKDNGFLNEHVYERMYKVKDITVLVGYAKYPENMMEAKEFVEKYKNHRI